MGGLTFLEQLCSITMLLAGTGAMLLLYAGLALERQRQTLAGLQRERVRAAYRARTMRGLLARTFPPAIDVVVIYSGGAA